MIQLHFRELIVVQVLYVSVFADCTVVELRPPLDFALAYAVLIQLFGGHLFCHVKALKKSGFSTVIVVAK